MRLLTLLYITHYTICSDFRETKDMRQSRHLFDLIALINSLRYSQNFGFQYSPFILPTPIIIVPPPNIQQTLTVQKATTNENYQEIGDVAQKLTTVENYDSSRDLKELTANFNPVTSKTLLLKRDVSEVGFPNLNLKANEDEEDTSDENESEIETTTSNNNISSTITPAESTTAKTNKTENLLLTSNSTEGPYPAAFYTFEVENVSLTTTEPNNKATSLSNETTENIIYSTTGKKGNVSSSTTPSGPYASASYTNKFIENLQLTTNFPNMNQLPDENDQRWEHFKKKKNNNAIENGFKPLAGLYYDGYLHQALRKFTDWSPNTLEK